jgi:hypothetical protein
MNGRKKSETTSNPVTEPSRDDARSHAEASQSGAALDGADAPYKRVRLGGQPGTAGFESRAPDHFLRGHM